MRIFAAGDIARIANPWIRIPLSLAVFPFVLIPYLVGGTIRGRIFHFSFWNMAWFAFWMMFEGGLTGD